MRKYIYILFPERNSKFRPNSEIDNHSILVHERCATGKVYCKHTAQHWINYSVTFQQVQSENLTHSFAERQRFSTCVWVWTFWSTYHTGRTWNYLVFICLDQWIRSLKVRSLSLVLNSNRPLEDGSSRSRRSSIRSRFLNLSIIGTKNVQHAWALCKKIIHG